MGHLQHGMDVKESCWNWVNLPRPAYFAISLFRSWKMSIKNAVKLIEESEARFVDLRITDTKGKQHHFTVPARIVLEDPEEWFENGQAFDGSVYRQLERHSGFRYAVTTDASAPPSILFMMMSPSSLPATSSNLPIIKSLYDSATRRTSSKTYTEALCEEPSPSKPTTNSSHGGAQFSKDRIDSHIAFKEEDVRCIQQ